MSFYNIIVSLDMRSLLYLGAVRILGEIPYLGLLLEVIIVVIHVATISILTGRSYLCGRVQ